MYRNNLMEMIRVGPLRAINTWQNNGSNWLGVKAMRRETVIRDRLYKRAARRGQTFQAQRHKQLRDRLRDSKAQVTSGVLGMGHENVSIDDIAAREGSFRQTHFPVAPVDSRKLRPDPAKYVSYNLSKESTDSVWQNLVESRNDPARLADFMGSPTKRYGRRRRRYMTQEEYYALNGND